MTICDGAATATLAYQNQVAPLRARSKAMNCAAHLGEEYDKGVVCFSRVWRPAESLAVQFPGPNGVHEVFAFRLAGVNRDVSGGFGCGFLRFAKRPGHPCLHPRIEVSVLSAIPILGGGRRKETVLNRGMKPLILEKATELVAPRHGTVCRASKHHRRRRDWQKPRITRDAAYP